MIAAGRPGPVGSGASDASGGDGWCAWGDEEEPLEEIGLYLPLHDDEGNALPVGPPWALTSNPPHPATETVDLLGYGSVEDVCLPSGAQIPCVVQPPGGLTVSTQPIYLCLVIDGSLCLC